MKLTNSVPEITFTVIDVVTGMFVRSEFATSSITEFTDISFSLPSKSTISMTTSNRTGIVYASAIQVCWKSGGNVYSHSLSSGAKAGIGVGVALISLIIFGIIV